MASAKKETVSHNIGITIRLDWESRKELENIALFEREKIAVLLRRIIIEKMQVYQRNPAYKRFLKLHYALISRSRKIKIKEAAHNDS